MIHVSGTGCCLIDYLYTQVDFSAHAFQGVLSQSTGDGGLCPGALVFSEPFEAFAGVPFQQWLQALTGGRAPDAENLGGPAIVALIHAAQMLYDRDLRISFHAGYGDDAPGRRLREIIGRTSIDISGYRQVPGPSPSTVVLSDPTYNGGKGERTFVSTIGAAAAYLPSMLGEDFFQADLRLFGATALVPCLHDHLTTLLSKGRAQGGINVVSTVYDFRNEQRHPEQPWPLGDSLASFPLIDLLVCDREEALRISGCSDTPSAVAHFLDGGMGSVVVTHGVNFIHLASQGGVFAQQPLCRLPVSQAVDDDLAAQGSPSGDTTGCGDNFLGGIMAAMARQMVSGSRSSLDLLDACAWGIAAGGYACFYPGGTFVEAHAGEKRCLVESYYHAYRKQIR